MRLIADDRWAAQEKMDGERRAAHAEKDKVFGANRKGLSVPLPQAIAGELQSVAAKTGTIRVDGEIIGDTLYVFDLHIYKGEHIHSLPWIERMHLAEYALAGCRQIKAVPVAVTTGEKRALWNKVKAAHGEGVVFKLLGCPVKEGRPNTGGDWLKFKFTESANCCVLEANSGKRSVKIGLLDCGRKSQMISVGNVTIRPTMPFLLLGMSWRWNICTRTREAASISRCTGANAMTWILPPAPRGS